MSNLCKYNVKSLFYIGFSSFSFLLAHSAMAETVGLAGVNSTGEDTYAYIGAVVAPGHNLDEDGVRLRFWGAYNEYSYDTTLVGGASGLPTSIDADGLGGAFGVGWRWNSDSERTNVTGYVNATYKDISIDPNDPASDTPDDDFGVGLQLEINHAFTNSLGLGWIGSFNVAYESYWTRARPGYTFANGLTFGPEVILMGDDDYDKQRYGAFLSGFNFATVGFSIEAGIQDRGSESQDDFYAGIGLSKVF